MERSPPKKKEPNLKGGDGLSVFNSLTRESENKVKEISDPICNMKDSAESEPLTVKLSPFPAVSCRITPTGDTVLSFQWEANN